MPAEADPPLVVDPDAVLSFPAPLQRLQLIGRRGGQVMQRLRPVQIEELAARRALEGPEAVHRSIVEEHFRFLALEGLDHGIRLFPFEYYVSQYSPARRLWQGLRATDRSSRKKTL